MPLRVLCDCPLCDLECQLLAELSGGASASPGQLIIAGFTSATTLLEILKMSPVDAQSDRLLGELFRREAADSDLAEKLLVLVFVPVLHRTIRRVALYQPFLSEEDITQQALACLLEVLRSKEILNRKSHYAFAISRALKRRIFEWGRREGENSRRLETGQESRLSLVTLDNFERQAELHHFFCRCVERGDLNDGEIELLIRFKLEGASPKKLLFMTGDSSNAVRQKMKRLLAKLRRLAARRQHGPCAIPGPPGVRLRSQLPVRSHEPFVSDTALGLRQ